MKNISQTKTVSAKKLPNSKRKSTQEHKSLKTFLTILQKFTELKFAYQHFFFTDPLSNTAKDDNSLKTDQEGRKVSSCT